MLHKKAAIQSLVLSTFLVGFGVKGAEVIAFGPEGKSDIPASRLLIVNRGVQKIDFSMSVSEKNWDSFALRSGKNGTYGPKDKSAKSVFIKMRTGETNAVSPLEVGKRYAIFWNKEKQIWDIELAQRR